MTTGSKRLHCALYTRKSSDEGLDQDFNSLDAQREACFDYVRSQKSEGWKALPGHYDDGGFSGGTMDRPGLKRLLSDIESGLVDVVVVYKIDRLTRSLADFARIVETFDAHGVSFVSVTQSFNTTSSMGRLTLNVLLSFAQFEREVTGERIRDKIAASKAKGLWMGGNLPLGYDAAPDKSRTLIINEAEATTVRLIFEKYLELESVHELERWLEQNNIRSKKRITKKGRVLGGARLSRGALFHLLRNKVYLGLITHKEQTFDGLHPPIIEQALFDRTQEKLDNQSRRHRATNEQVATSPLTGKLFNGIGIPYSPTFAYSGKGKLYRYYVLSTLQKGQRSTGPNKTVETPTRVSAHLIEQRLEALITRLMPDETQSGSSIFSLIKRIEIRPHHLEILLPIGAMTAIRRKTRDGEDIIPDPEDQRSARLSMPCTLLDANGKTDLILGANRPVKPDHTLIDALRQAHALMEKDKSGKPYLDQAPDTPHKRKLIRLAFLAPDIQAAIVEGTQPHHLSLNKLINMKIPPSWDKQRHLLGFAS